MKGLCPVRVSAGRHLTGSFPSPISTMCGAFQIRCLSAITRMRDALTRMGVLVVPERPDTQVARPVNLKEIRRNDETGTDGSIGRVGDRRGRPLRARLRRPGYP